MLIGLGVLGSSLIKLGLRLRHLILQVFPANVRERKALFHEIAGSAVASSPICSSYLTYIRYIAGATNHKIYLSVWKDGRAGSQCLWALLRRCYGRERHCSRRLRGHL